MNILKTGLMIIGFLCIHSKAYTKPPQAILKQDVTLIERKENNDPHSLCKAEIQPALTQQRAHDYVLIGQVKATASSSSPQKIVQIIWTGVQLTDKKRRKGYFAKPLISTFKAVQESLPQGTAIDVHGDLQEITRTLAHLEQTATAQGMHNNPALNERRVEGSRLALNASLKTRGSQDDKNNNNSSLSTDELSHYPQHGQLNSTMTAPTEGSPSPSFAAKSGTGSHRQRRSGQTSRLPPMSSAHQTNTAPQTHVHTTQAIPPASAATATESAGIQGDKNNGDNASSDQALAQKGLIASSRAKKANSQEPEGLDPSSAVSAIEEALSSEGEEKNPPTKHNNKPFAVDHEATEKLKLAAHQPIEVEITENGCTPRVDFEKNQYVIQNRSITRQGGNIIEQSPCSDSQTWYAIKRDYSVCHDEVDRIQRVAYTRFRRYWLDDDNKTKHYLDAHCVRDESQPHPFIDDPQNCSHHVDLTLNKAWQQVETLYINREHARKIVERCHKVGQALPIIETAKGCPLKHLFERNYSLLQKRSIFMDQGVEHTVVPCHESTDTVAHAFVRADCQAIITDKTAIPMAKRQVTYRGKTVLITTECEPMAQQDLVATPEGCEGQYYHDYAAGRSYQSIRWYYVWKNKKRFVTPCQRSNTLYPHETHFFGLQNCDDILKAKPRYVVSIMIDGRSVPIKNFTETDATKFIPYVHVSTDESRSDWRTEKIHHSYYDVQDITTITTWRRPDNTLYIQRSSTRREELKDSYEDKPYNDMSWGNW